MLLCYIQDLKFVSENLGVRYHSIRLNHLTQFVATSSLAAVKLIDYTLLVFVFKIYANTHDVVDPSVLTR